ncbi:MAG TPA: lysophospholipid acyltransferase family protein [Candidatus Eisenbacteria bacterium]|nr:lysophospholipid acyltransferase family protein [Candidatus Eisenbacteria bacterium]
MTDFGYLLASTTACTLPRPWSEALAAAFADLYTWIHPKRARAIEGRLRRIWSETGRPGAPPSPRETYRAFSRAVLDFLAARPGKRLRVHLDDESRAILEHVRASGRATVIVSGHFGPWEVALQWLAREMGPVHALAQAHRSRAVERFFAARRAAFGVRTLSGERPVSVALGHLRSGGWIAALADRGSRVRILNRRPIVGRSGLVPLDPTPLLLARRANAQILAGVASRASDGAIEVRFHPPFTIENSLEDGEATLQQFFDAHVRAHPTQWFHWAGTAG